MVQPLGLTTASKPNFYYIVYDFQNGSLFFSNFFYFLILALKFDFVHIPSYLFLLVNLVHRHINDIP